MENKRKELEKLPLYLLRQKGRHIGVKAPSTLDKRTLINAIVDIEEGIALPVITTRGRPALEVKSFNLTKKDIKQIEKKIEEKLKRLKKDIMEIIKD